MEKKYRYLVIYDNNKQGISINFTRNRKFKGLKKGNVVKLTEAEANTFPKFFRLIDDEKIKEISDNKIDELKKDKGISDISIENDETDDEIDDDSDDTEEIILYDENDLKEMKISRIRKHLRGLDQDDSGTRKVLTQRYLEYVNTALSEED